MASKIYRTILLRKIDNFIGMFQRDSESIFYDKKNNLIHPGEFGKYRENVFKDILKTLIHDKYSIGDGFIFTSKDNVSTQCDVIIYNSSLVPLIKEDRASMFPIEEVRVVGEVKSTLKKSNFIESLIKLSKIKMLQDERLETIKKSENNPNPTYNTIGSFLIVNKLDFDLSNINFDEIYKGIPRKYWHSAVLSIEDGLFIYGLDFSVLSPKMKEFMEKGGFILSSVAKVGLSLFAIGNETINTRLDFFPIDANDKYRHILDFLYTFVDSVKYVWTYYHDPIIYMGLNGVFFKK
jgi:hypothetical protein